MSILDPLSLGQYLTLLFKVFFVADLAEYMRYLFIMDMTVNVIKCLRKSIQFRSTNICRIPSRCRTSKFNGGGVG